MGWTPGLVTGVAPSAKGAFFVVLRSFFFCFLAAVDVFGVVFWRWTFFVVVV